MTTVHPASDKGKMMYSRTTSINKNLTCGGGGGGGGGAALGHVLRRRSYTGRENPQTPIPTIHNGTVAHVRMTGLGLLPMLWHGTDEGLSLKFTPTRGRTQDMMSATHTT
jgi:hypothetical protein